MVADVAATVFGASSIGFYVFQITTALILILAANTAYNAFPRLGALLAEDGYMPRQFAFRGDRLAYTLGIVILSGVAIALLVWFNGDTHALIPLYSVGVFVSFTLSQSGMVRHWLKDRDAGWRWKLGAQRGGCRDDRRRARRGAHQQGAPVAVRGRGHPGHRPGDAVHLPPVRAQRRGARRSGRTSCSVHRGGTSA